jgi:hypothetical protein
MQIALSHPMKPQARQLDEFLAAAAIPLLRSSVIIDLSLPLVST